MGRFPYRQVWQSVMKFIVLWISLWCKTIIVETTSDFSGSSYFLFQQSEYPRDCKEILMRCESTNNTSGVYTIKPEGYREPFEVYCDNGIGIGGWTVLQRRINGSITFNRNWADFKNGFGFLGSEFWLGNDKIAFLTNQKSYELRLDFLNDAGQSYYTSYNNFRISDEWGGYLLSSLKSYRGTAESYIEWCPANEVFSNQTCERTCEDPDTCISGTFDGDEKCVCIGNFKINERTCIPNDQCPCFVAGLFLQNGQSYVNLNCTRRSNCSNNQLSVEEDYQCSDDATCDERNGVRRCYCNNGYGGDGVTCSRNDWKDCHELYLSGTESDGVYTIYPDGFPGGVQVYCEMESNGGGWTIFQRHSGNSVDFYRFWSEYKDGFGDVSQDHWLGNKYIHAITNQKIYQLRIDLMDSTYTSRYALHSTFSISDEADNYRLSVGSYSGNTGDNAMGHSNNKEFSTRDRDNDRWNLYDCADRHRGGWWYHNYWRCRDGNSESTCRSDCPSGERHCDAFADGSANCAACARAHLNGDYDGSTRGRNFYWNSLTGHDCLIKFSEMKIRPA